MTIATTALLIAAAAFTTAFLTMGIVSVLDTLGILKRDDQ